MCFFVTATSQPPSNVHVVVKSFDGALSAAKQLLDDGAAEKIWVLGGKPIYQVLFVCLY
jgi:dihydrofolate reductase